MLCAAKRIWVGSVHPFPQPYIHYRWVDICSCDLTNAGEWPEENWPLCNLDVQAFFQIFGHLDGAPVPACEAHAPECLTARWPSSKANRHPCRPWTEPPATSFVWDTGPRFDPEMFCATSVPPVFSPDQRRRYRYHQTNRTPGRALCRDGTEKVAHQRRDQGTVAAAIVSGSFVAICLRASWRSRHPAWAILGVLYSARSRWSLVPEVRVTTGPGFVAVAMAPGVLPGVSACAANRERFEDCQRTWIIATRAVPVTV